MLGFQGIIAREFISMDGHFIVTVCFGHEHNLKKVYEYLQINKFLDISMIDLMSLEPLDSKRRPLRLHKVLQKLISWEKKYGSRNLQLFHDIKEKTRQINYMKMVREFNGLWDKDLVEEKNAALQIYEHSEVAIGEWENYYQYLVNLSERVAVIRKEHLEKKYKLMLKFYSKFYGKTDFGLLVKRLTERTQKDDYFHFRNMQRYLQKKQNSKN